MLTLVLGGPGCGKTTALLNIVDSLFENGTPSHRIGYFTFTRKAAQEAMERCSEKFGIHPDDLPYFSTLHSFAFNQLALTPQEIMSVQNYKEFGAHIGMEVTRTPESEEGSMFRGSRIQGDKYLSLLSFARITQTPLRKMCEDSKVDFNEVEYVRQSLKSFKEAQGLLDFTDMLEIYLNKGIKPYFDALIVDEAQDLSALQWRVVEKLAENTPQQFFAGDDDQAIYEWAGADVDYFLALKGEKKILPISYRLKRNVFDVCQTIVANIGKRFYKEWAPYAEGGVVERVNRIEHVKIEDGTWLMLARNKYLLNSMREYLYLKGFPFMYDGKSSVGNDRVRAILYWEALRKGKKISGAAVKLLYSYLHSNLVESKTADVEDEMEYDHAQLCANFGLRTNDDWMKVLRMPTHEREYYREVKLRGESLLDTPRITISTIHGVKGGEADHVLLCTDMSVASYRELVKEPSSESRVFYVAASRAKKSVTILNPMTNRFYPIGATI
jgi:DNA helicase-2/ATP-dependent DNA helicase PcrA